jgi:hypothetical protein
VPSTIASGSDTAPIDTVSSKANLAVSDLCFQANAQVSVPEPNSIAVIVTAVGGLATLLRRRKPRHGRGQAFRPT